MLFRDAPADFVKDVSFTFGTRLLGVAAGVITLTLTTRLLGPAGRGQFAVAMAALGLVLQVSNCGLHASAIYHLSRRPALRDQVTGLLFWLSLGGVGLMAGIAYMMAMLVPALLPSVPLPLLGMALLGAPPAMFLLLASNAFLGLGSTTWFNGLDLGTKAAGVVAVGLLVWWPLPVLFGTYALLQYALAAVAYLSLVGPVPPPLPELRLVRQMFGYGLRAFLTALVMFLVLRLDLFLVNALLGATEAGRYSVAVQVAEILSLAAASIAAILFPRLAGMPAGRRWPSTRRVTRMTAVLLGLGALVLATLARPLFLGWFGVEFVPAIAAFWWLLPGVWCLGVNTVLFQHLAAAGMPWFCVASASVAAAANVVLNVKLIPAFGIAGAAGASSASYALLLVLSAWYLRRADLAEIG